MPSQSFFALCNLNGESQIKRIVVNSDVQTKLNDMFSLQESDFRYAIQEEVEFTGDWKPEEDEALYVSIPDQTNILEQAIQNNSLSFPTLNPENLSQEGVKAIFTGRISNGNCVVAIQGFSSRQLLEHKFSLVFKNNVLNELTSPVFTLDSKLVGLIENCHLKFKSYSNIRQIFDLTDLYRAATDEDIDGFVAHSVLEIEDLEAFKNEMDQTSRKLVHALQKNNTLDQYSAGEINQRAQSVDVSIHMQNGKILLPSNRADIKLLLRFLHDDIYEAPLSGHKYVTNSKKAA